MQNKSTRTRERDIGRSRNKRGTAALAAVAAPENISMRLPSCRVPYHNHHFDSNTSRRYPSIIKIAENRCQLRLANRAILMDSG